MQVVGSEYFDWRYKHTPQVEYIDQFCWKAMDWYVKKSSVIPHEIDFGRTSLTMWLGVSEDPEEVRLLHCTLH